MSCNKKTTEVVLLGTVHQTIPSFTPDSLYNILVRVDPDLILYEFDSSLFTPDFQFKEISESNESIATAKFMNHYDVDIRPYDFTGRNGYRKKIGSRPADSRTIKLMDSLSDAGFLTYEEEKKYNTFQELSDTLNSFAYLGVEAFNNSRTDSIARLRQEFLYKKLLEIVNDHQVFAQTYIRKDNGDSISYAEGYRRAGEFWTLRNRTMAGHILNFINQYEGKRIVVLNGYFHRYYLNSLLEPEQDQYHFLIKEFYEY